MKKRCIVRFLAFLAAAAWLNGLGVAWAEEYKLESITVTADKREENIREVPSAITVFTETELEDAGIENIEDVIEMVPNLTFSSTIRGENNVSYRGLNASIFTNKNPVVIYVDGVPLDNNHHYDSDLLNIKRVEVLRGPQGTLYGKNAMGGVINIITKQPGNEFEAKARVEVAEHETYGVKGSASGPVVKDKLFLGLAGKYYETRGYMKNDHPDQDYFDSEELKTVKSSLRWLASDRTEVNFTAGLEQRRDGGDRVIASDEVRYHETRDPDDKADSDSFTSALNITHDTDFAQFTSVTTFLDSETEIRSSQTFLPDNNLKQIQTDVRSLSQEIRLQSPKNDSGLKWLGGLYYLKGEEDFHDHGSVIYFYNQAWFFPGELKDETMAAFGQVTFPFTSRLDFTAGLRYERVKKELDFRKNVYDATTGDLMSATSWNREEDWDALLPKGVLSFRINSDAMVYASVAKGYLAGGLNAFNDDRDNATFDEQTSLNYEIGAKTAWFDNRLFLNTTLFYTDIKDMHVYSVPTPGIFMASNAGEAHSQGIEIEAKARPFQGLDIGAAIGFTEAEFDDYKKSATVDYTGKEIEATPAYTLNLNVQYRHSSGFFARAEMEGYGKTYYYDTMDRPYTRDSFELFNAKVGYEGGNWDIYLYADNLFDKAYFSAITYGRHNVGKPQTLGMIASVRF